MISLFMDTHSKDLNIGLVNDNILLDEIKIRDLETHSNLFLCKVDEILKNNKLTPNDVDRIIVVNGPGSFTGIRIAVTDAKVFAWGLKKRIVTISSLKAYALSADFKDFIISVIDARRGYVYAAIYDSNYNEILGEKYMLLSELLDKVNNLDGNKNFVGFCNIDNINVSKPNLDILSIVNYCKSLPDMNSHLVNPNYLKKTEAEEKNDKTS